MLNPAQAQAVHATGGCLLITAPPGSGKTTVLKERAVFLLRNNPEAKLAAVTFTADAAGELKERILASCPGLEDRLIAGTFHALCKKQLERNGSRFMLVSESQRFELIKRAHAEIVKGKTELSLEDALLGVDAIKSKADPIIDPLNPNSVVCYEIYERYQALLRQMGGSDFSDLMIDAVKGMKSGVIAPLDVKFLLIDEFQDTDDVQYAWAKAHFRRGVEVSVVGDDDQAIYGWRNALGFEGMERFRLETNASHISLNTTYRCAREILFPAATLISNVKARVEKDIQTANKGKGVIITQGYQTAADEMMAMVDAINASGTRKGWAILARSNKQLSDVSAFFLDKVDKFIQTGGVNFWELPGPSVFLGVCNSLIHGNMIGVDELLRRSGVGESRIEALHTRHQSSSSNALRNFIDEGRRSGGKGKDTISKLSVLMGDWKRNMDNGEVGMTLWGIGRFIKENVRLSDNQKIGLMSERNAGYIDHCVNHLCKMKGPLSGRMIAIKSEKEVGEDAVRLMTLHSAKGLEFKYVWMMGCEEGIIPSKQSTNMDEERRLFYVGMTRAIDKLICSYTMDKNKQKSRFLIEAGL